MQSTLSFADFEALITDRLKGDLPGRAAQGKMASTYYKGWPVPRSTTRHGAVLLLFYPDEQGAINFPVILRPKYDGVHSGQISFPGGKVDPSDRDVIHTALREAWEEIKAPFEEINIVGQLSEVYVLDSDIQVVPVVGTLPYKPEFVPDAREVENILEIKLEQISNRQIIEQGKIPIRGGYITAPFYNYNGLQIWGATAMMISEMIAIIEG